MATEPPSSLTPAQVRKVADLARLALSNDQLEQYRHQLGAVLTYMHRLSALDLANVEPMTSPLDLTNRLADDTPGPTLTNAQLMAIAPPTAAAAPFVQVPKVLGEGALMSDPFLISADPSLLDFDAIHRFLTSSYWSPGIPRDWVERAAANSLCFGVYDTACPRSLIDGRPSQVGFARMITDKATFAYLADVFILESHRGRGLSKQLMAFILAHPDLHGLRRLMLITRDAHALYTQFGFAAPARPEGIMEKKQIPDYARAP